MSSENCPKCGARVYVSDDKCMDCGTSLKEDNADDSKPDLDAPDPIAEAARDPAGLARAAADSLRRWARAYVMVNAVAGGFMIVVSLQGGVGFQWAWALGLVLLISGFFLRDLLRAAGDLLACMAAQTQNTKLLHRDMIRLARGIKPDRHASNEEGAGD